MKMIRYLACVMLPVLLVSCGLFIAPRYEIQDEIIHPFRDGYIDSGSGRYFADPMLKVDDQAVGAEYYILLGFDVMKRLPVGARIVSAHLKLNCIAPPGGMDAQIKVYRIKNPWDETSVAYASLSLRDEERSMYIRQALPGEYSVDIPGTVQAWVYGVENCGILLASDYDGIIEFEAMEANGLLPELHVRYY
jgi:hypothetical protein